MSCPESSLACAAPTSKVAPRPKFSTGVPSSDHPWLRLVSSAEAKPEVEKARARAIAPPATEPQNPLWWWAFAGLALFALAELGLANRTAR